MRRRHSSRLLIIDPQNRVLLFRFRHNYGALAGQNYWATPGGGLEPGETFEEAARRELLEETGIVADAVNLLLAGREFVLQMPDGESVIAVERFFLFRAAGRTLSRARWTPLEREVMAEHRWWSVDELASTNELVFPKNLPSLLATIPPLD